MQIIAVALEYNNAIQHHSVPNNFIFWMHIVLWACPHIQRACEEAIQSGSTLYTTEEFRTTLSQCNVKLFSVNSHNLGRYGYHVPYIPHIVPKMKNSTVSMFRRPMDRLVSAYLYREGLMLPRGSIYHSRFMNATAHAIQRQFKNTLRQSENPVVAYATHPEIPSCQTKMVLGYHCGESVVITYRMIAEAKRRIREEFIFFGLTHEPDATLMLFNTIFGANMTSINSAIRRNYKNTPEITAQLATVLRQHGWLDGPDEALYAEAEKIFYARCEMYGIPTQKSIEQLPHL